jgi:hypothetical protein
MSCLCYRICVPLDKFDPFLLIDFLDQYSLPITKLEQYIYDPDSEELEEEHHTFTHSTEFPHAEYIGAMIGFGIKNGHLFIFYTPEGSIRVAIKSDQIQIILPLISASKELIEWIDLKTDWEIRN